MVITKDYIRKQEIQRVSPKVLLKVFNAQLTGNKLGRGWIDKIVGADVSDEDVDILLAERDLRKNRTTKSKRKAVSFRVSELKLKEKKRKKDIANLDKIRKYKKEHGISVLDQLSPNQTLKAIRPNRPLYNKKAKHKKITKRTKQKQRKEVTFYDSRAWRDLRYKALKLHGRRCLCCGAMPPDVILHVDHIKPRSLHPELELDINNLQILCKDCNLGKSNLDSIDYRTVKGEKDG